MQALTLHLVAIGLIVGLGTGCRTSSGDKDEGSLIRSAGRDSRPLEDTVKLYTFELGSYDAFADRIDWSNYYEDVDTRQRTNFVIFKGKDDTECTIGLTSDQMSYLKTHPETKFQARTLTAGRTKGLHQSQIFFSFKKDGVASATEFLSVCTQPDRRVAVSDVMLAIGSFVKFVANSEDTPTYNVCCECKIDTLAGSLKSGGDTMVAKGDVRNYLMVESNDSICRTRFPINEKVVLRPGDPYFKVKEARYQIITACDETLLTKCASQMQKIGVTDTKRERAVSTKEPAATETPVETK